MVSIRKLEKMLRPYEEYGGFSSEYTEFYLYKKGNIIIRVDEYDMLPFGKLTYRESLENAARELGLI